MCAGGWLAGTKSGTVTTGAPAGADPDPDFPGGAGKSLGESPSDLEPGQ